MISITPLQLQEGQVFPVGSQVTLTDGRTLTVVTEKDSSGVLKAADFTGIKALADALSVNASITTVCQIRQVMRCLF